MSGFKVTLLILGMALVTYIPRMIPAVMADRMKFGPKLEKLLKLIPYTAMSALIFPGVFLIDENNPAIGIIGALAAGILAFKKAPMMICVIAAIAVDFLLYSFVF